MLDYLIHLLDFTVDGESFNLFLTPWQRMLAWISSYQQYNNNQYSTAVRDAYEALGKLGFMYSVLVVVLLIICCWLFYKIAHGFAGWMQFR